MSDLYKSHHDMVIEWYMKFKQDKYIPDADQKPSLTSEIIDEDRLFLKLSLIAEEFIELVEASLGSASADILTRAWDDALKADEGRRDVVEAADATGDLRYVLEGFDIEANIPSDKIFQEIQLSNMSKLQDNGEPLISDGVTPAPDGKIKPAGKILKGEKFFAPDLKAILDGREPNRTPEIEKNKRK